MSLKSFLTLDVCILSIILFTLMLAASWGYERQKSETENVQLTQLRIDTVVHACAQLDPPPRQLRELLDKKLVPPETLEDAWGHDLLFDPGRGVVYSLGADGLSGGEGFATDIMQRLQEH